METFIAVGLVLLAVYVLWRITKALAKTIFYTLIVVACGYLALPYLTADNRLPFLNRLSEKGSAIVDDTIEDAKDLTKDHIVDPLKKGIEPVKQLEDAIKTERKQQKRGVE